MICHFVFPIFRGTNIISLLSASSHFISLVDAYYHSGFVFEITVPKQIANKHALLYQSREQQCFFPD